MTIDEAVKIENEIINDENELMEIYKRDIKNARNENHKRLIENYINKCNENIEYHNNLKTWLIELKQYKED